MVFWLTFVSAVQEAAWWSRVSSSPDQASEELTDGHPPRRGLHVSQLSKVYPVRNDGPCGPTPGGGGEHLINSVQTPVEQFHGSSHRVCGSGLNDLLGCEPESWLYTGPDLT